MEQLREEFQQWLSNETWNWTTYATLTFSRPMKKDALRFVRAWVQFIARTAKGVSGFCFQETHWDGQRLHAHCLLSVRPNLIGEPSNREMWSWWFQKFGRAQVVTFRRPRSKTNKKIVEKFVTPLASYLTKYMVKEAFSAGFDWDFYAFEDGFELTSDEFHRCSGIKRMSVPLVGVVDGLF